MIRVIKRYESRKLYDTEESRYISLDDIAQWVRSGQEVRVIDNATSADVSSQILTQIIHDEGKRGTSFLPTELLHELVRAGERAFSNGVEQVQTKVDRLVQASIDRLGPVRRAREEMVHLRDRLSQLEKTLAALETNPIETFEAVPETTETPAPKPKPRRTTPRKKTTAAKSEAGSEAAKKKTPRSPATRATSTRRKTTTAKTTTRGAEGSSE